MKELLPIGSVVLLQDGKKKVMIIGIKQTDQESKIEYDYLSVLYPEGFVSGDMMFFFNHDAIQDIYHMGYRNEEYDFFRKDLEEFYHRRSQN